MKRQTAPGLAALAALAVVAPSSAAEFVDNARVMASTPVFERVAVPRQECWNEVMSYNQYRTEAAPRTNSPVGAIVGGVAGGVLGNQIGHGSGRAAATAIGAVTGAVVGDRIANDRGSYVVAEPRAQEVQRCRTIDEWRDEVRGYDVTYRYNGRDFTTRMPFDPGPTLRVGVSVTPEPGRPGGYRY
jgi:uncharacterized protein YcfJ